MSNMKIRQGDKVVVIAGKYAKEQGTVERVDVSKKRVFVGGVNVAKKHTKARQGGEGSQPGGIVDKLMSIHISNVQLVDNEGNPSKVSYAIKEEKKVRVYRTTQQEVKIL